MAAPKIALRKISTLNPDPQNARTHSADQIEMLVASIERFGFTVPGVHDENNIVRIGNARLAAVSLINERGGAVYLAPGEANGGKAIPAGTIPIMDGSGYSADEWKALALGDNQLALQAGWDHELLMGQIGELQSIDFSIDILGFDKAAIEEIQKGLPAVGGKTDPDEVPEPPANPVSMIGDVWLLGDHHLACGDSTNPEAVADLLDGEEPQLMVTDPPYGVEYDASWRGVVHKKDGKPVSTGKLAVGKVENDDRADWTEAWDLFPGRVCYVWHGGVHSGEVQTTLESAGFNIRSQIIWNKGSMVLSRGDYHWKHEPCWYAVRKGKNANWQGGRKQTTVWDIDKPTRSETGHSTQKPVECMLRPIENNSKVGESVYEPFSGSSTTVIACEMSRRRCFAMELSPAYVDVGVARWEEFTGKEATLLADGRTFAEVKAERIPAEPA